MDVRLIPTDQILFKGQVQGVGFRWTCCRLARELGLQGWVRNLPDMSVEAVFQGDRDQVRQLLEKLMLEPGRIRITESMQRKLELPEIKGFAVR